MTEINMQLKQTHTQGEGKGARDRHFYQCMPLIIDSRYSPHAYE